MKGAKTSSLLISEPPLQVLPSLAVAIGLNEAILVQQVHYWLSNPKAGISHNGHRWVWNSMPEWKQQFPFWSERTIQRIARSAREAGFLLVNQIKSSQGDQTNYYAIDYDTLNNAIHGGDKLSSSGVTTCRHGGDKLSSSPRQVVVMGVTSCRHVYTENPTETSSENPTESKEGAATEQTAAKPETAQPEPPFAGCKQPAPADDWMDADYEIIDQPPTAPTQVVTAQATTTPDTAPVDMSDIPDDDPFWEIEYRERLAQKLTESRVIAQNALELHAPDQSSETPSQATTGGKKGKKQGALVVESPKAAISDSAAVWNAYATAYTSRYQCEPTRNAKTNACIAGMIKRIGAEDAAKVAAFYPTHGARWYVQKCHDVGSMLADCEKLRMEVLTGRMVTSSSAAQADKTAGNMAALYEAWNMIDREAMAA